ncbi:MAG: nucleotide pyrophosphatase/phosphodiesterase family protein [Microbacterium sp.]
MPLSLPAEPPRARSLTGVVPQLFDALDGRSEWFAPATSAIVLLVDGLGAANLAARSGHARFLSQIGTKKDVARTVFPSTTATALTGLLTGARAGEHGIVGYRARIPGTDAVLNQLRGWDTDGLPLSWQRAPRLVAQRPSFVVSKAQYAGTGFTQAIMGEAEFVAVADLTERAEQAAELAARHPGSFVYLYMTELDAAGHKYGWQSEEWITALERVDAAARALGTALAPGTGAVVTGDHGMVDVPRHRQILLSEGDALLDGVDLIGGEPRMLHLYAEPGRAGAVRDAWEASESGRSWVMSRDEAIAAGLFGPVDDAVRERIGDVLVAARAAIAYYDDREADKAPQNMIGQHGSLTNEERVVPLLRLGAIA